MRLHDVSWDSFIFFYSDHVGSRHFRIVITQRIISHPETLLSVLNSEEMQPGVLTHCNREGQQVLVGGGTDQSDYWLATRFGCFALGIV